MKLRSMLLAGLGAFALPGCVVSVTDTERPAALAPLAPLAHAPITNDAPHGISQSRLAVLDATMKQYVADQKLAGAVVMIHQDGREVFSEAYGWRDREANDRMEENDIFRIASQTKALTSVAIMMLMEEGPERVFQNATETVIDSAPV